MQQERRDLLRLLAAAGVTVATPSARGSAPTSPAPGPCELIHAGEAALQRGDAVAASEAFERAGAMRHAFESEMGAVRAAMQLGDYGHAAALAAHVAGEHLDAPGAAVLHAWLLRLAGPSAIADQVIRVASQQAPDDALVVAALHAFAQPVPMTTEALRVAPHRVAPFAMSPAGESPPPGTARIASSGALLPGGRHALAPGRPSKEPVWVRNGLGATRIAHPIASDDLTTLYRLDTAIDSANMLVDFGEPRAGTPAAVAEYGEGASADPAWPWLRTGFLGAAKPSGDLQLGVDFAGIAGGAPVLDRQGRLVGIAMRDREGHRVMHTASHWPGTDARIPPESRRTADLTPERLYERAMRVAVQMITVA